jgi:tRNA threonylcarbamoyladenosine modification (KEOPS) complex Cgi121 subunit
VHVRDLKGLLKTLNDEKPAQVDFQLFDARLVATWEHLYFAALNALVAFKSKRNISKSVAVETLLYASAQYQIQKAMRLLGVKPGSSNIAVLIMGEQSEPVQSLLSTISENVGGKRDERVLELSEEKSESIRRFFGISENQLRTAKRGGSLERALVDLVIERVALVAVQS